MAKELIDLAADVILVGPTPIIAIVVAATRTIPIVFATAADPVGAGFVESLARPGRNVTGFTNSHAYMGEKWLQYLKEMSPTVRRVGVMFSPKYAPRGGKFFFDPMRDVAASFGVGSPPRHWKNPRRSTASSPRCRVMRSVDFVLPPDGFTYLHRARIMEAMARHQMPAIYPFDYFTTEGGLMSYGPETRSKGGGICRSDLEGRKPRRFAGAIAAPLQSADQPQDSEGARARGACRASRSRGPDRRMTVLASENDVSEAKPAPARGRLFRKYLASLLVVVCVALIANGALDAWFSYQEQKRLLIAVQRVEADAAATKIGEFINQIEDQIGWLSLFPPEAVMPGDPRLDAIRLLRLEPAIAEIARLDPQGREEMRVSRNTRDVVGSGADLSATPAFLGIKAKGFYHGPVYFFRETEPYMTIGVKGPGRDPSVYIAEVNLRFIWDLVSRLKVGATGNAYVVDAQGRLVAHPELWRVLRNTDLSRLAQVHAALTGDTSQDAEVAEDLSGHSVLSAHALVPSLGWHVFVELPIEEGYASIRASIERSALLFIGLLGCAVAAAFLLSRHMTVPIQALARGAERIGVGHLDQRIKIKTGDEPRSARRSVQPHGRAASGFLRHARATRRHAHGRARIGT